MTSEQRKLDDVDTKSGQSSQEFEKIYLKENCSTRYGYTQSAADKKVGPKFLRITDIQEDIINWEKVPYCEIDEEDLEKFKLEHGDIVVARTGASTGSNAIYRDGMPDSVFASYLIRVRSNERLHQEFLYRFMQSQEYKDHIKSVIGGSAQPNANAKDITEVKVPCPPKKDQKKIAQILLTFDKKIKLNKDIVRKLDNAAKNLFKYWFIEFGLYDEFKDSKLGEVPNGFEIIELGEILSLEYGDGLSKDDRDGGKFPVYGSNGINGSHSEFLIEGPGVIVGRKGTIGTVEYEPRNFWCIDTTFYLKAKDDYDILFYYHLLKDGVRLKHLGSDSAVPGLNRNTVHDQEVALPNKEQIEKFVEMIKPMYKNKEKLRAENERLKSLRDTLFPKLMSGEIRVNDIGVEELEVDTEV